MSSATTHGLTRRRGSHIRHPSQTHLEPDSELLPHQPQQQRQQQHQELDLGTEPSCCNKLFLLIAIVTFVTFLTSSAPTIFSAQQPQEPSSRPQQTQSSRKGLVAVIHPQDKRVGVVTKVDSQSAALFPTTHLGNNNDKFNPDDPLPIHPTPPLSFSPSSSSQTKATESWQAQRQEQDHAQMVYSPVQGLTIMPLVLQLAKKGFDVKLWLIKKAYRSVAFVVAKPVRITVDIVETPFTVTRDIWNAFLPLYSFFTIAALIGIVIGGISFFFVHALISAVGADQDPQTQIIHIRSKGPPRLGSLDQELTYRSKRPSRPKLHTSPSSSFSSATESTILSSTAPSPQPQASSNLSPVPDKLHSTRHRSKSKPARSGWTHITNSSKARAILTDNDDDDDDDEDATWDHV
ncbi:hypothetical protein BX616_006611 [Lobosporangium transversale]|nr:hypothetical protein BX616_006611 [Lobosporangium transversale]